MDQWEVKIKSIKYPKKQEIEVLIKKTTKIKINNEIFVSNHVHENLDRCRDNSSELINISN